MRGSEVVGRLLNCVSLIYSDPACVEGKEKSVDRDQTMTEGTSEGVEYRRRQARYRYGGSAISI